MGDNSGGCCNRGCCPPQTALRRMMPSASPTPAPTPLPTSAPTMACDCDCHAPGTNNVLNIGGYCKVAWWGWTTSRCPQTSSQPWGTQTCNMDNSGGCCNRGCCPPPPTASPTMMPSASPTLAPTPLPTSAPTASPTMMPSASPTPAPTALPTGSPSAAPSASSTDSPSAAPSASPTDSPSAAPQVTLAMGVSFSWSVVLWTSCAVGVTLARGSQVTGIMHTVRQV